MMCLVIHNQTSSLHRYQQQCRYTESQEKFGSLTQQCSQIPSLFPLHSAFWGVTSTTETQTGFQYL